MTAPLVVPFLLLAGVLLVSGAAKVSDRMATADMFTALRVPFVPPAVGATALPYAEIVLGLALLLARGPLLVVASGVTLLLFTTYWLLIARALTFDPPVSCACFGKLGGHLVDGWTLARNTVLVGLSVVALVSAARGVDVLGGLADFTSTDVAWLCVVVIAVVLTWLVARSSAVSDHVGADADADALDYDREPIPYGVLENAEGRRWTLRELSSTRARLLVFLSPGCGPCERVGSRLDRWASELDDVVAVHAVYFVPHAGLPKLVHGTETTLFEPDMNVTRVFGGFGTPSAVLLGADGYLAGGPVSGEDPVETMVRDVLDQVADAQPGHDHEHDHQH